MKQIKTFSIGYILSDIVNWLSMLITGAKTRVSVGNQIFEIPTEKTTELFRLLSQWQSIQVNENNPSPNLQYQGRSLING